MKALTTTLFAVSLIPVNLFAADITNAVAGHLAIHRLERLVTLGKIDKSFQEKFRALALATIPHANSSEPAFKAVLEQYPATDGSKNILEVILSGSGRSLKDTVLPGGAAIGAPTWPDKDAVTLSELAQHYLLEKVMTKPELLPFVRALVAYTISQKVDTAGNKQAQFDILSSETKDRFRILLRADGTIVSGEIVSSDDGEFEEWE